MTIPSDYDDDPGRWRNNRAVRARFGSGDLHGRVARRFVAEGLAPVLDVGCGNGDLAAELPRDWPWIGVDPSPTQLAAAPRPTALAVATSLPAAGASVGAVAFLWM